MAATITGFSIEKLHDSLDVDVNLTDSTVILVGENGSGKTTVLRMLFYCLSGQWNLLSQYTFKVASIRVKGAQDLVVDGAAIAAVASRGEREMSRRLPPSLRHKLSIVMHQVRHGEVPHDYLMEMAERYGIPMHVVMEALHGDSGESPGSLGKLQDLLASLRTALATQVVYLPTYRRIEQEFESIFPEMSLEERPTRRRWAEQPRRTPDHVELIEFGMRDVEEAIAGKLEGLKDFARERLNALTLGYLGDVVDQKYTAVDLQSICTTNPATVTQVLDRISEQILTPDHKSHLLRTIDLVRQTGKADEHGKVLCHYLLKLLAFQEELLKREKSIAALRDVCNSYFGDDGKRFVYDSSRFTFRILQGRSRRKAKAIELPCLSSGEKQIVSLFSHLYLSGPTRFLVIIDEPELSLSVPWQRKFLVDIRQSQLCSGIIAATHSPFVYENELDSYARGLGEFVKRG